MSSDYNDKSSVEEIKNRFNNEVSRFDNLETGQRAIMDAPLMMDFITFAGANVTARVKTVLDIGCGAGNNTLKLLQRINPLNCHLLDLSPRMLERALERVGGANRGETKIIKGDIREAELPRNHYDVIIAAAVLHHLRGDEDWEKVFRKLYDITAPGGSIWISDLIIHENRSIQDFMWNRYGEYLESAGGLKMREAAFSSIGREDTPRTLTYQLELLKKSGFAGVEILHKNGCFAAFGAVKK